MSDQRDRAGCPIFNPELLRDLEQMEAGMAQQILQVFREDLGSALTVIAAVGNAVNLRSLVGPAHKLKGGSGSIGAVQIQLLATQLEVAATSGKTDECHRLLVSLQAAGREFLERITVDRLPSLLNQSNPVE